MQHLPHLNRHRLATGLAALTLLVPGALARGGGDPDVRLPLDASGISRRDASGHRRMLEELMRVALRTRWENDYLGDQDLIEVRERLLRAGNAQPVERAMLRYAAGTLELRAGHTDLAIAHLEAALAEVPLDRNPRLHTRITYRLGLAHMRAGEDANCVTRHTSKSCILPIGPEGVHRDPSGSRAAIERFEEVLARAEPDSPMALSARWLLNVMWMTLGDYPAGVPEEYRLPIDAFAGGEPFPRFEEVGPRLGLNTFNLCGGAVVEDFDGDGLLDVLSSTWEAEGPLQLLVGLPAGGFRDATAEAGLDGLNGGLNLVPGDYNGDGWVDVLVLRGAWLKGEAGQQPNSLLRNEGEGFFTDVTFNAGLGEAHYPTQTAAWADYDGDGDLDLYVGNEATRKDRFPSQLFRNEGDGTFTDASKAAGVRNFRYAKGVTWGDYDGDGRPDLFVSNLGERNRLYHNEGDGTFRDVAAEAGVQEPRESFPTWFWDFDNDGNLDLYVGTYYQGGSDGFRLHAVVADALGLEHGAERHRLYRGDGHGNFREVGAELGLARIALVMGANFGDLDNDGFLDFYLGTGYPGYDGLMPNLMFHNLGGRRFADVTASGGFGHLQKGHAVAFADLDGDGDQDVFEQMGGAYPGDGFGNVLYENPGNANHWVKVRLEGVGSNRMGLGAVLRLDVVDDGQRRSVFRHVGSVGSFGGNPFEQHVGLGAAVRIERLEVRWPATGTVQVFEDLPADRVLRILEGSDAPQILDPPPRPFPFRAAGGTPQ